MWLLAIFGHERDADGVTCILLMHYKTKATTTAKPRTQHALATRTRKHPPHPPIHPPHKHKTQNTNKTKTYQDVLAIPAFASSDEAFSAEALLSAYASGKGAERVRAVASVNGALKHLDAHVARLAVKLPSSGSDVAAMGRQLAALMGNGGGAGGGGEEDEEDEDLT